MSSEVVRMKPSFMHTHGDASKTPFLVIASDSQLNWQRFLRSRSSASLTKKKTQRNSNTMNREILINIRHLSHGCLTESALKCLWSTRTGLKNTPSGKNTKTEGPSGHHEYVLEILLDGKASVCTTSTHVKHSQVRDWTRARVHIASPSPGAPASRPSPRRCHGGRSHPKYIATCVQERGTAVCSHMGQVALSSAAVNTIHVDPSGHDCRS